MRHKWSIKKVRKYSSAYCVHCGLIKEMSDNGVIFYFKNDSSYDKAGDCPRKQSFNIQSETDMVNDGTALGIYGIQKR